MLALHVSWTAVPCVSWGVENTVDVVDDQPACEIQFMCANQNPTGWFQSLKPGKLQTLRTSLGGQIIRLLLGFLPFGWPQQQM
jgi:hypothetical protein